MKKRLPILFIFLITALYFGNRFAKKINFNTKHEIGEVIDSLNGVKVYYNGGVGNVDGRNLSEDGYNLGIKYQCVEFVKRYYYERFNHKMPDTYGHAKHFFDPSFQHSELNTKRNLLQFEDGNTVSPQLEDLIVFSPTITNRYGHVAIISKVENNHIEIIQQNPGPFGKSRATFELNTSNDRYTIKGKKVKGWLRISK